MNTQDFKPSDYFTKNPFINSEWIQTASTWYKQMADQQRNFADASIKRVTAHLENLGKSKNPQEFLACQQAFLHDSLHAGVDQLKSTLNTTAEQLNELIPCCQKKTSDKKTKEK